MQLTNSSVMIESPWFCAGSRCGAASSNGRSAVYRQLAQRREETLRDVRAWQPFLVEGALLVFDDFTHPEYPGVREAVAQLWLDGEHHGTLFVHRVRADKATRVSPHQYAPESPT
jgi:hypothetical protein